MIRARHAACPGGGGDRLWLRTERAESRAGSGSRGGFGSGSRGGYSSGPGRASAADRDARGAGRRRVGRVADLESGPVDRAGQRQDRRRGAARAASRAARRRPLAGHGADRRHARASSAQRLCEAVVPKRARRRRRSCSSRTSAASTGSTIRRSTTATTASQGRITDPEFVRGVVQCLKARGHTEDHDRRRLHRQGRRLGAAGRRSRATTRWRSRRACRWSRSTTTACSTSRATARQAARRSPASSKTRVPTLLMPKIARRAPRPRALHLAAEDQGAPLRGVLARHQGHAGHDDVLATRRRRSARSGARTARSTSALELRSSSERPDARADVRASRSRCSPSAWSTCSSSRRPTSMLAEGAPAMGGDGFEKLVPAHARTSRSAAPT